ncbi:MAG: M20/M25/M40 family metallo-hydrolase [Acidobacteria bacterium]|nr:M20/M25/M40 family metallo-hydrolase [Acidobacteriota bacterium]
MRKFALLPFVPLLLAEEKVDLYVVNRIKAEASQNSRVMEHAFYMSDVFGSRLVGSTGYKAAADWTVRRMREWGLSNPRLEKWTYGRGWDNLRFYAAMKAPSYQPLIGVPRPLSLGTGGRVSGEAVLAVLRTEADLEEYKGKLRGKIVLTEDARTLPMQTEAMGRRYTDTELAAQAFAPDPGLRLLPYGAPAPGRPSFGQPPPMDRAAAQRFRNRLNQFLRDEGVLVTIGAGMRGDGGTVFSAAAGTRDLKDPMPPASVALAAEHYNRIYRLLEKKVPVTLEFDIENKLYENSPDTFNVLADLPGGAKKDEIVMVGAHLDSWTFGTGATDDTAGCAVMMEVMRILKALDLKMARTVRIALWSAEEEGLLGSAAYVKQHVADRETMALGPEHAKISGYFNLDNGGGKIRGVYLQGNDMMRPIFEAWLQPFHDLGASTVTVRNTTGTDHLSFDAAGVPAFQFIQDPLEYMSRTHHSNMDVYDRLQSGDLMQASAIIASLVYDAATRDERLPRKPLPKPQPRGTAAARN